MAAYLDEDMMGRDPATIGFPHVLLCMSFVARTNADLWGVHLTWPQNTPAVFAAFWNWAQGKGLVAGNITDIYGSCNRKRRYETGDHAACLNAWTNEMQGFANHLTWHGPAHGFDTRIIHPGDGTYIEYNFMNGSAQPCTIFYKRNEKTEDTGPLVQVNPGGDVVAWNVGGNRFRPITFQKPGVVGKVSLFHSGVLHEVDYALRLTTINV